MSLAEARKYRKMPFLRRGMRADMNGKGGRITGGDSAHLRMRFDGQNYSSPIHPTWEMTFYAPDGSVVKDYKQKLNEEYNRRQQGENIIWTCVCGEEMWMRCFKSDTGITETSCGNCGECWWIDWKTGALGHGSRDEALLVLRSAKAVFDKSHE